jgi:hypothetical protein
VLLLKVGLRETVGGILIFECLAPDREIDGNCKTFQVSRSLFAS